MSPNFAAAALKHLREHRHDPAQYVRENADEFKQKYTGVLIVVRDKEVLASGEDLDALLEGMDLSVDPKIIAGTVDSILAKNYVWVRNDYAPTPHDMATRHSAFASNSAELEASQLFCAVRSKDDREQYADEHMHDAASKAMEENKRLSADVYQIGSGFSVANFE